MDLAPVDVPQRKGDKTVGPLKTYDVKVNGAQTRLILSEEDARLMGVLPDPEPEPEPEPEPDEKARPVANKARTPRNKAANEG